MRAIHDTSDNFSHDINTYCWQVIFFHRKSKTDAGQKFKSMIDSEDENSEKENVSSNDADDIFN